MATRNLTKRFNDIRNSQKANQSLKSLNITSKAMGSSDEEDNNSGLLLTVSPLFRSQYFPSALSFFF
jgi:hypothetical protein